MLFVNLNTVENGCLYGDSVWRDAVDGKVESSFTDMGEQQYS